MTNDPNVIGRFVTTHVADDGQNNVRIAKRLANGTVKRTTFSFTISPEAKLAIARLHA